MVKAALLFVLSAGPALLATEAAAQQRHPMDAEAEKLCLAGRPEAGAALLAQLYVETGDANYIYNQGRCFQQNGKADEAIARFREYIRKMPGLTTEERADVQRKIAECEEMRRPATDVRTPQAEGPPVVVSPPSIAPESTATLQRWRTVAIIAGAVALAGGATASFATRKIEGDAEGLKAPDDTFDPERDSRGHLAETLQWVGYGLAGAAAVTTVILHVAVERAESKQAAGVSLAVDARSASVLWRRAF